MKNLELKALSILIAILLAYFVHREGNISQVGFVVPIEINNVPSGKVVVEPDRAQAQVTVRGPSFLVAQIPLSPPVARISVPENRNGLQKVRLTHDDFSLPPGVEVVEVSPAEVNLVVDDLVSKTIPIVVPQIGTVSAEFSLDELVISPEKVVVEGPASALSGISSIESEPIDLRGMQESVTRDLLLRNGNPLVRLTPLRVNVQTRIVTKVTERRIPDVPIGVKGKLPTTLQLELPTVNVVVKGPRELLRELRLQDIAASVRIPTRPTAAQELNVTIELPENIELLRVEPQVVLIEQVSAEQGAAAK